jgi:putative transposase
MKARQGQSSDCHALVNWKDDYNHVRPHSAIGNIAPFEYAKLSDPAKQRDESLELFGAPRPVPLHNRAGAAQTMFGLNSLIG